MNKIIIDSNVLVGILDERDSLSANAIAIYDAIRDFGLEILIFDCVVNEATSVLCRRCEEQKRESFVISLLKKLDDTVDRARIVWSYSEVRRLYSTIMQMILEHQGRINFHDALILLLARQSNIELIASFDRDFDDVTGVRRVFDRDSLHQALQDFQGG